MRTDPPNPLQEVLRTILPFRFLSPESLAGLLDRSQEERYPAGHWFMHQGDTEDQWCYIILEGRVEVLDGPEDQAHRFSVIESGHYFGEWESIFDLPRRYGIRGLTDSHCLRFPGPLLLDLARTELGFAQAFSAIIRDRQGIFKGFELFRAEVLRGLGYGHIHLNKLLPLYKDLKPALHPGAQDEETLDFAALDYAIRRLPANVGTTFAFLIRDELPSVFENPDHLFTPVPTDARRRSIWEVLPGKDLITVRSGVSDIMDFLTCLCVYSVEARKIRRRLYQENVIPMLKRHLAEGEKDTQPVSRETEAAFIRGLGFHDHEAAGLLRVWPKSAVRELWNIINHREMFSVDIRRQLNQYSLKNFNLWSSQIGRAVRTLLGRDPRDLKGDVAVHIISSNTHSVANCLNPWYADHADRILAWATEAGNPLVQEPWHHRSDLVYALARDYFRQHPGAEATMLEEERRAGILRLEATPSTGIEAQCIDLSLTAGRSIDPDLPTTRHGRALIINIDYAFGEQAEDIIHQLILLFGRHVRSVNFLGKAGALVGKRSDILVPEAFIEQGSNSWLAVPDSCTSCADSIKARLPHKEVHVGPMLTVQGTLVQNREMLQFYHRIHQTCGIEMEGYFYHRQVEEAKATGLLDHQVASRFFYYVSDLPLDTGSNLSERLRASEGIPPLYAISREILERILRQTC